jgi:hypothetical protein
MKKITLKQMELIKGSKSWLAAACGFGVVTLEASFAFPALFALTAPLTVSVCTAAAIDAAIKSGY